MTLVKVTYTDNVTHIPASNMNAIQDEIISHGTRLTNLENGCDLYYGTCSTSTSNTKDVILSVGSSFELRTGTLLAVKFTYSAVASSTLYLNVNSTGAKEIRFGGVASNVSWGGGATILFEYDGTYWQQLNQGYIGVATTTTPGFMSAEDKVAVNSISDKLDTANKITNAQIDALFT